MAPNTPTPSTTATPPTASSTVSPTTTSSPRPTSSPDFTPALTTHWTRPEKCGYTYDADHLPGAGTALTAYLDRYIDEDTTTLSCYPPGMFESGNSGTFSPASCPTGWYTVDSPDKMDSIPASGRTTRTCCSKQFTLNGDFCEKHMATVVATPVQYITSEQTPTSVRHMSTYLVDASIAHHPIVILFQEKDQEVLGIFDDDEHIVDPDNSSPSSKSSPDNLPIGAKVGIGMGTAVALSLLLGLLFWFLRRTSPKPAKIYPSGLHGTSSFESRPGNHCRSSSSSLGSTSDVETGEMRFQPQQDVDPPPAYEPSPQRNSLSRPSTGGDGGANSPAGEELRALKEQQEAIRRRIEQLEGMTREECRERRTIFSIY